MILHSTKVSTSIVECVNISIRAGFNLVVGSLYCRVVLLVVTLLLRDLALVSFLIHVQGQVRLVNLIFPILFAATTDNDNDENNANQAACNDSENLPPTHLVLNRDV